MTSRPPATKTPPLFPDKDEDEIYSYGMSDDDLLGEGNEYNYNGIDPLLLTPSRQNRDPEVIEMMETNEEGGRTDATEMDTGTERNTANPTTTRTNESTANSNPNAGTITVEEKLLKLRKEYKKTSVALTKAKAHGAFVASCKEREQTPRGLKVRIRCTAMLPELTEVRENFRKTTGEAESKYVDHLDTHYKSVEEQMTMKQNLLRGHIQTILEKINVIMTLGGEGV